MISSRYFGDTGMPKATIFYFKLGGGVWAGNGLAAGLGLAGLLGPFRRFLEKSILIFKAGAGQLVI